MKKSHRLSLLALEPRLVFDGAAAVTPSDITHAADGTVDWHDWLLNPDAAWVGEAAAAAPAAREVVVVDAALPQLDQLLSLLPADLDVVQVQADQDGLSQALSQLQGRSGLSAIHILTHGESGVFGLGATQLSGAELQSDAALWRELGQHLSAEGALTVYGCDLSAAAQGDAFVKALAHTTGASALSDDFSLLESSAWAPTAASTAMFGVVPSAAGVDTSLSLGDAPAWVQEQVLALASSPDAVDRLFGLFHGDQLTPSSEWRANAQAFVDALVAGETGVRVQVRTDADLQGAHGAFAAVGPNGEAFIYISESVLKSGDTAQLLGVLMEETGHWIDANLNPGRDTSGDEGQLFALRMNGVDVTPEQLAVLNQDNDRTTLLIDGVYVDVELASLPSKVNTPSTQFASVAAADAFYGFKGMYSDVKISALPSFAVAYYDSFEGVTLNSNTATANLAQAGVAGSSIGYTFATQWSGSFTVVPDGKYAIVKSGLAVNPYYSAAGGVPTATDGNNFMIVNGTGGIPFYRSPAFDFMAPGLTYSISFNFRDSGSVPTGIKPNMKLEIIGSNGQVMGTLNSGTITQAGQWFSYYTTFVASSDAGVSLKVSSVAPSGSGNDFMVDNFRVTLVEIKPPLEVYDVTVNEGSPYAVFKLMATEGLGLDLKLNNGTATGGADFDNNVNNLEYFDPYANGGKGQWKAYVPGVTTVPSDGDAKSMEGMFFYVRVGINQDAPYEISENFTLTASYREQEWITAGVSSTGTGTILDNGTGSYFSSTSTTPLTAAQLSAGGITLDDDSVAINDVVVNEASPYAIFKVSSGEGVVLSLNIASGTAVGNVDYSNQLEYFDGSKWVSYVAGSKITVPNDGDANPGEPTDLLVRVAINQDLNYEVSEQYTLSATNTRGKTVTGIGTILDDGTGPVFGANNTTGEPDPLNDPNADPTAPGYDSSIPTQLDDDRPLVVRGSEVNEASPYLSFEVDGFVGQDLSLALSNGSATEGTDTTGPLEYFDGSTWVAYTPGTVIQMPAIDGAADGAPVTLKLRLAVVNDTTLENTENLTLTATNRSGSDFSATGLIFDNDNSDPSKNNGGSLYPDGSISPPETNSGLSVTGETVNEASPFLVYTVSGTAGQTVSLDLQASGSGAGHAILGTDVTDTCYLSTTTLDVVANDWGYDANLPDPTTVMLYDAATGGTGAKTLTVAGEGTYTANDDGTVTFVPVAGLLEGTPLTPIFYTVDGTRGLSSGRTRIDFNVGASSAALTPKPQGNWLLNGGFDAQAIADGAIMSGATPTSWKLSSGFVGGYWDPNTNIYTDANLVDNNVAYLQSSGTNYMEQASYQKMVEGEPLQLTFRVGDRLTNSWTANGGRVYAQLIDSTGKTLATRWVYPSTMTNDQGQLEPGTFKDFSLVYVPTAVDAGKTVIVRFGSIASQGASGFMDFDSFDLHRMPVVSAVDGQAANDEGCTELEYFDGNAWVAYTPGAAVTLGDSGELLVRTRVVNDGTSEGAETLNLVATDTTDSSITATGVGTIVDDGTGDIFLSNNPSNTPNQAGDLDPLGPDYPTALDNDVTGSPRVNNLVVNEGSPYAVFTVSGVPGAGVSLALGNDSDDTTKDATLGTDTGTTLEYFDPVSATWKAYNPAALPVIPADGNLQVRTAIKQDDVFEATGGEGEVFTLAATYTSGAGVTVGGSATGTATIMDDGTGTRFLSGVDVDPSTPGTQPNQGMTDGNVPQIDYLSGLDDDRPYVVNDVVVNEASPYAIFTVTGTEGQQLQLGVSDGTAQVGDASVLNADAGTALEYFDGLNWVAYTPGSYVTVPYGSGAEGDQGQFLVRVAIQQDANYEVSESYKLNVTNTGGKVVSGIGTILDDGTGPVFGPDNTDGLPDLPGENGIPADFTLDDDRVDPLLISEPTVNETAGYMEFDVTGGQDGTPVALALKSDTGTVGADTTGPLQYSTDGGSTWTDYDPNNPPLMPEVGGLKVRTAISTDALTEGDETVQLVATDSRGLDYSGTGTIIDVPPAPGTPFLAVSGQTVNEKSPYLVYTVTGGANAAVTLNLAETGTGQGHVTIDADTSCTVEQTTINVLANDAIVGTLNPSSVLLYSAASGGTGVKTLNIANEGSYQVNADGSVTFTPVDGVDAVIAGGAALTPVYYDFKNTAGQSSNRSIIDLNDGMVADPKATGQWWEVDLGSDQPIDRIELWNRTDAGTTFRLNGVELYVLDENHQVVAHQTMANPAPTSQTLSLSGVNGRYVQIMEPNATTHLSIAELKVFSNGTNIALNQPAIQSSMQSGGTPDKAVDGNTSGVYTNGSITHTTANLPVAADDGLSAPLACHDLEYFDGTDWVLYDDASTVYLNNDGELLVRVRVVNDGVFEDAETLDLVANAAEVLDVNGNVVTPALTARGTGTIVDDGTGVINTDAVDPTDGTPVLDTETPLNDDRGDAPRVNNLSVNEGSPYAVFTVTGVPGTGLNLSLGNDSDPNTDDATLGTDTGTALEYFDTASSTWKTYTAGNLAPVQPDGQLLVRVAIKQDTQYESGNGGETFTLNAAYNNLGFVEGITVGGSAAGTATILDNGTGDIYLATPDDPATVGTDESNKGVTDGNTPQMDIFTAKDDDRPLSTAPVTVNEASPYIVFTVQGEEGQPVKLSATSGTATLAATGGDASPAMEYFNGTDWVPYTPDSYITIPSNGDSTLNEPANLLVRMAVAQDTPYEASESFTFTAINGSGTGFDTTGTILDNGQGDYFTPGNTTGAADEPPGPLDDDRPFNPAIVNDVRINEGSPYAVFTVSGVPKAEVTIALRTEAGAGMATMTGADADFNNALEVFVNGAWVAYDPGNLPELDANGELLVRTTLNNQVPYEGDEAFYLDLTYTGNWTDDMGYGARPEPNAAFSGTALIVDDGSGVVFGGDNTTGTPDDPTHTTDPSLTPLNGRLDDDRAVTVNSIEVNEASPYAVFTVDAAEGQLLQLSVTDGTATLGTDTHNPAATPLQYFNGSAWVDYTPGDWVAVPAGDQLLVRTAVTNDAGLPEDYEGPEDFQLHVSNTGGTTVDGTATIYDDGRGDLFGGGNTSGVPDAPNDPLDPNPADPTLPTELDNDVPTTVNSIAVNEASPYAVFTVTSAPGIPLQLALEDGTAGIGADTESSALEVFDPTANGGTGAWVPYSTGDWVTVPNSGELLVRTAIQQDDVYEKSEAFTLKTTGETGYTASGTCDILDNATGEYFSPDNTTGIADVPPVPLDDDRALSVKDVTVNEASPYAVFEVTAIAGEVITLGTTSGAAVVGADTGTQLEYFDGTNWVAYNPGDEIAVPAGSGADGEAVPLLVRTAVVQDGNYEGAESFALDVAYASNPANHASGTGTIVDDGTGDLFGQSNTSGVPDAPWDPLDPNSLDSSLPTVLDDDRPLEVTGSTVGEDSPHVHWTVTGEPGQWVSLDLVSGSAEVGNDVQDSLEYFDGFGWQPYTPGQLVAVPDSRQLQVRAPIHQDGVPELAESLTLVASNTNGTPFEGDSTITDNGPVIPAEDTPLSVSSPTVNEASPYMVFNVGGQPGQTANLSLNSGTGTVGTDTGSTLEYFDGTDWVTYDPENPPSIPNSGDLPVRTAVVNDGSFEGPETVKLVASTDGGLSTTGTGTITDDGTGNLFSSGNTRGVPDAPGSAADLPATPADLDDDRANLDAAPSINSFTVNEGSPYAVFTIGGVPGAGVDLSLSDGTAEPADHGSDIEVYDPETASWVPYDPATAQIGADGKLLARVAIVQDDNFEGGETFDLKVNYNDNGDVTPTNTDVVAGTATIIDDGTGDIFLASPDDPATPETDPNNGVQDGTTPELDYLTPKDDDRPLGVSDVSVNEASPYAVFEVTAVEGQALLLDLKGGTAQLGTDTGEQLEYFDGSNWVAVTPGTPIVVPALGGEPLLVRTAIQQDANFEGAESFELNATYASNPANTAAGTGTITDDGTGDLFGENNTSGVPDAPNDPLDSNPLDPSLPTALDDDRPLDVTGSTVGEDSPNVHWNVAGEPGQLVSLDLVGGSATLGADVQDALEYFDGTDWVAYTPGDLIAVPASGDLQVRAPINADIVPELAETVSLVATNAGGTAYSGESTITDEGPVIAADEKPLSVSSPTVNEASPYMVFKVGGQPGQTANLSLDSGTGTVGTDTGSTLEYFDGTNWVTYDPENPPTIPASGNLPVRTAVVNDGSFEGAETVKLVASTDGGLSTTGTGTITDDGTGDIYLGNNPGSAPNQPGDTDPAPNAPDYPATLNDDRTDLTAPPSVNDITINEGSPYAVFTIGGVPGAGVDLALSNGTASDADHGSDIEVYDPVRGEWVAYDPATTVIGDSGTLLARVAVNNNPEFEGPETFSLDVGYNSNGSVTPTNTATASGTATIMDDGTGDIFLAQPDDPATPMTDPNNGVQDGITPELDYLTPKEDHRPLGVSDVSVNEASPYAVFEVTAVEGQALLLDLKGGTAQLGTDTGTELEYFDGSNWVAVTPGTPIVVPALGGEPLLVRTAIQQDANFEGAESFELNATYASNPANTAAGTGTITDDGTGDLFGENNTTGTPDPLADPTDPARDTSLPTTDEQLDDDRPLQVTGSTVGEDSPNVHWNVAGEPGQLLSLDLVSGSGTVGLDVDNTLEYFDGTDWQPYTPGDLVPVPASGELQVRAPINADGIPETAETITLVASNANGTPFEGDATITDEGPVVPADEKPLSVSSPTVNEASPYMVFKVGGQPGQTANLSLDSGTGTVGTDTQGLEYFNGSNWVAYDPQNPPTIPASGNLPVRTTVVNDGTFEGPETVKLVATTGGGLSTTGTGTITDDGTGDLFGKNNTTGTPEGLADPADSTRDPSLPTTVDGLNDDRLTPDAPPSVSSFEVNEGSPYAVFTVGGVPGAGVDLALSNGSASDADHGQDIEVYDPVSGQWLPYNADTAVIGETGKLLARVALTNDPAFEGPETFSLSATYNDQGTVTPSNTSSASGTATILDDGTGDIFLASPDAPSAPYDPNNGVQDGITPELDYLSPKEDHRSVSIDDVTVNEASPYAVFTVSAVEGQDLFLSLSTGTAQVGEDTGAGLEYFDGKNWVPVVPGQAVTVPQGGTGAGNEMVPLLVRTAIQPDANFEGPESFQLNASYANNPDKSASGTGTIMDDGTGDVFGQHNTSGTPDDITGSTNTDPSLPKALDDDRPLQVTGSTVGEDSPNVHWNVAGEPGQLVSLDLVGGSATLGADVQDSLEYFNGTDWVAYTPGSLVPVPASGELLVRAPVNADSETEFSESLTLVASNANGTPFEGDATITDEGPVVPADEKPLSVSSPTVNEASPYMVFKVGGQPGQTANLSLDSGTGTVGTDTGSTLEYFNGTAWVSYDPQNPPTIPTSGNLPVRTAVVNDGSFEGAETVKLVASTDGGLSTTGTGTITDDGTGDLFGKDNTTGTPDALADTTNPARDPSLPTTVDGLNDDRLTPDAPPSVSSFEVNEGSPYAVFAVGGVPGAGVDLALSNGSASDADHGQDIEVYDPEIGQWVAYDPATAKVGADGKLLARVALANQPEFEGPETFSLNAKYNSSGVGGVNTTDSGVGTATILDDGTGDIFLAQLDDPATPAHDPNHGVQDGTTPELDYLSPKADHRPLAVNSVEVNEASPYAVFTVDAVEGQPLLLDLEGGSATLGKDTGKQLEYFDGTDWKPYTPGQAITVPSNGNDTPNETVPLWVRTAIVNDFEFEEREQFTLNAQYANGNRGLAEGTATIRDDGKGDVFGPDNVNGQPDVPAEIGIPFLDDDRTVPVPPVAPPPAPVPAEALPAAPPASLHVQGAVADGRQAVSVNAPGSSSATTLSRATGGRVEGSNELHRTDQLIDKFDRVTDPNLYVLPQVQDARNQSFEAKLPTYALQSGLLPQEVFLVDSKAVVVQLSDASDAAPTLADQTLAELSAQPQETDEAQQLALTEVGKTAEARIAEQLAAHLAAVREAAREAAKANAPASEASTRGQLRFSEQLKRTASQRAMAHRETA